MNKAIIVIVTANNQRIYWLFCWDEPLLQELVQ